MGPFGTAVVEPLAGLGRIVVGLQARICTCQIHNLPCSHALVTIDVAGKQVTDYIPHYHTLRPCLGKNGRCNGRFINNRFGTGTVANRCAQPRRVWLEDRFELDRSG